MAVRVQVGQRARQFASGRSNAAVKRDIAAVAKAHEPDGGYGDTAWHAGNKTVFWVSADWTSTEEHDAAWEAFLGIDGVEKVDGEAEAGLPDGDGWDRVWPPPGSGASIDPLLALASKPLNLEPDPDSRFDVVRDGWEGKLDTKEIVAQIGGQIDQAGLEAALKTIAEAHRTTIQSVATVVASAMREPGPGREDAVALATLSVLEKFASRPDPQAAPITVNVPPTNVHVDGATVNVPAQEPAVVHIAAAEAPIVNVTLPEQAAQEPPVVNVTVEPADTHVDVHVPEMHVDVHVPESKSRSIRVEYGEDGTKRYVPEEMEAA